jgi:hypothetical protein
MGDDIKIHLIEVRCTPEKQQAYRKDTIHVAQKDELHWLRF